jgi:sensor histidine kinase regulating citrate/malate metabolism
MHNRAVRALFITGLIVLVLGIASLFVSVPVKEKHGIKAGPVSVGVETTDYQKVPPAVSVAVIAAGVALMIAGARKRG